LRRLLLAEEIFPRGYGQCSSHKDKTLALWKHRKNEIILQIEAATDIAAEMGSLQQELASCTTCQKACTAAVDMLAYKCRRLPKSIVGIDANRTGEQWLSDILSQFAA